MEEKINEIEDQFKDDDYSSLVFKYSITSYGADYPVDSLVKRVSNDSIYVPPFQRNYVWSYKKACRFIESLLLGLPVPGIFISREIETGRLKVIDGQQRLRTLQFFYEGIFQPTGKEFRLIDVNAKYEGITYKALEVSDRRDLDNAIIHATVVKQDEPSKDESSIYQIFERLNTGGSLLSPQEIRTCIYHGSFNDMLIELNNDKFWREIFGVESKRKRDLELILRFLALKFNRDNYKRPMKEFLNLFMGENRDKTEDELKLFKDSFLLTIKTIYESIGEKAFRPVKVLNAAVYDAVMVGLSSRLDKGEIKNNDSIVKLYDELLEDTEFKKAYETATTDDENIKLRMSKSIEKFQGIE